MRIPDYYVRFVDFPPTVLGATLPNDDGTFSVYINARLGDDARRETLRRPNEHCFVPCTHRRSVPPARRIRASKTLPTSVSQSRRLRRRNSRLPWVTSDAPSFNTPIDIHYAQGGSIF